MLCTVQFTYNLFDPLIGHWTIWFYYSANQTTSIQSHLIMTKHGARTLAISNCISLLAGCLVKNMEMIFMLRKVITKRQGTKCVAN